MGKKGISPVIATVLLISMVVVIGLIVFLWFRGIAQEQITKFGNTNIEAACDDIVFEVSYASNVFTASNLGNVPIYDLDLKISEAASFKTVSLRDITSTWPEVGLKQGGRFSESIVGEVGADDIEIKVIPVLVGTSESGTQQTYGCGENYALMIDLT